MNDYQRWQKNSLEQALISRRAVVLTGPRQCGKTTLARKFVSNRNAYRTLDDLAVRQSAENDPHLFVEFAPSEGTLIIDEVQKVPDLLPAIKKVLDQNNRSGQFLITGSANILNLPTVQESLAGRLGKIRLRPLSRGEIIGSNPNFLAQAFGQKFQRPTIKSSRNDLIEAIFQGGFPEALRMEGKARKNWHIDYVDALIEHDLSDIANIRHTEVMKDLVRILAAWSSKFMDISSIGSALSVDRRTLANYISTLQAFYIVEAVPAWRKTDYDRLGKQSKLFMADTGMMTALLGWRPSDFMEDADKAGKAFETFVFCQLASEIDAAEESYYLYQYRDHDKREIDFLIERDDRSLLAIEVKSGITVKKDDFKHIIWFRETLVTKKTVTGIVLYAGEDILPFGENLWAVPIDCIWGANNT